MPNAPAPLPKGSAALTAEQARALQRQLTRQLDYLRRLQQQMNKRRWPADDPLLVAVEAALHAVEPLHFRASLLPGDLRDYDFTGKKAEEFSSPPSAAADPPAA